MTRLADLSLRDGFLRQQVAERRAGLAAAKAAARRARDREAGPTTIVVPGWATPRQAAAARAAAADVATRSRVTSKVQRGWEAVPLREAPPGCVPVAMLVGRRVVKLAVDGGGVLRLVECGRPGSAVAVAEAAAMAAGR